MRHCKKIGLAWVGCIFCMFLQAQDRTSLDSLRHAYRTARYDTSKILLLVEIGFQYFSTKPDTCLALSRKALEWSERIRYARGKVRSLSRIGVGYWTQGDYPQALQYFRAAHDEAEATQDWAEVSKALNNMGHTHYILNHLDEALAYFQRGLAVAKKNNNKQSQAVCLGNMGKIYIDRAQYDTALQHLDESLEIAKSIRYKRWIAECLNQLGLLYTKKKQYDKALAYYQEDLAICKETGNDLFMIHSLNGLALLYQETGDYEKSLQYGKKGLAVAQRIHALRQIKDVTLTLYQTCKRKGTYADALAYFELHKSTTDSIFNAENDKKMTHIEMRAAKAETEKKDVLLKQERQASTLQRYIMVLIGMGLCSMVIFSYFIFRSRQKERKDKELISQQHEEISTTLDLVEAERAKSDKLLRNILPTEIATELKETGETQVRYFEQITVLFVDVKGFSALAMRVSPQALIAQLDATFTKMDEISARFGLERIKTIGDCYMACGGLPHTNQTHTLDVVLASLHIQHWLNAEYIRREGDFWQARLGAHTGEAVAGVIGKTKFAYDVWGNTVNLASRMENAGEVGKVTVSETTFRAVQDFFEGQSYGEIDAKNIGKIGAYCITRLKPAWARDDEGIEPNEAFWAHYRALQENSPNLPTNTPQK